MEKSKLTIAKSLSNTLQEEEPTPSTEEEVIRCENEEFISNHIRKICKYDFGRKHRMPATYESKFSAPSPATRLAPSSLVRSQIALPKIPGSLSSVRLPLAANQAVPVTYPPATFDNTSGWPAA